MFAAQFGKAQRRALENLPREKCGRRPPARPKESGYVMLTLMLIVALMGIVAMTVMVPLKFEMQRDREEEMIHRGVQYTRAIRLYYKKFGRYPTRLEDLENTNNLRYLRKRYTDPMNKNQPFRLLHYGEPGVTMGGAFGGGIIPGATPVGGQGLNGAPGSAFGSSSGFGNNSASGNQGSGFGNNSSFGNSNSSFGNSNSAFGNNSNSAFGSNAGVNPNGAFSQPGSSDQASSSGSQTPGQPGSTPTSGQSSSPPGSQTSTTGQASGFSGGNGQPIASGPIVGVASVSKAPTIRLYNKKTKYNEWQFLYDPSIDTGGLIKTPYQPALANFMAAQGIGQPVNGQTGQTGNTSTFGGSSSSGSSFWIRQQFQLRQQLRLRQLRSQRPHSPAPTTPRPTAIASAPGSNAI
jgi:type II secretory pathway pseudopilin PulG